MKFKSLILFALSLFAILSFTLISSATTGEPDYSGTELRIISKNLSYRDSVHLLVACDNDGVDSSKIELVVWNYEPESTEDTPTYVDTTSVPYYNDNDELMFDSVFESFGIFAKDISDNIYMATHIKGTDVYSKIYRYSALEYLYERITLGNPTDEQLAFYESVIAYSENAQILLKHDVENSPNDLNYVAVKGGTISDGYSAGTYLSGSEITISASSPDDFTMWTNADGEVISYEPTFTTQASDKTSLFISVKGYSITVNTGEQSTTTVHAAGDVISLNAPVYTDTENGKLYFSGWKNSSGEIIANAASTKVTVKAAETYTATYSAVADIDNSTFLDYSTNDLPIFATSPTDTVPTQSEHTNLFKRGYLKIEPGRENVASKEYVNTFFDSIASASSTLFSFDFKLDLMGDGYRENYTGSADSDTLYKLIYTTANVTRSINVNIADDGGEVVGYNLVDEAGRPLATLDVNRYYSISVEISKLGDKTLTAIYLDGALLDLSEIDSVYIASDSASLSICINNFTRANVRIDNTTFYSLN